MPMARRGLGAGWLHTWPAKIKRFQLLLSQRNRHNFRVRRRDVHRDDSVDSNQDDFAGVLFENASREGSARIVFEIQARKSNHGTHPVLHVDDTFGQRLIFCDRPSGKRDFKFHCVGSENSVT